MDRTSFFALRIACRDSFLHVLFRIYIYFFEWEQAGACQRPVCEGNDMGEACG